MKAVTNHHSGHLYTWLVCHLSCLYIDLFNISAKPPFSHGLYNSVYKSCSISIEPKQCFHNVNQVSICCCFQGILSPEDARKAVDTGVDGIVVSNHGGRQLDYSPATLDMIAPIRAAIGHRVPLLMDGGIRRGTDVLKVSLPSVV